MNTSQDNYKPRAGLFPKILDCGYDAKSKTAKVVLTSGIKKQRLLDCWGLAYIGYLKKVRALEPEKSILQLPRYIEKSLTKAYF